MRTHRGFRNQLSGHPVKGSQLLGIDLLGKALLAHLLNIKARISRQGARRLQLDIDYLENWVQTSAAVPPCLRAPLLRLPVLARCRHVLALLLPPKLMSDEINSSPLPDKHAWIARRSRTKRGLFC